MVIVGMLMKLEGMRQRVKSILRKRTVGGIEGITRRGAPLDRAVHRENSK